MRKFSVKNYVIPAFLILALLLTASCGKKGFPTLKSFEKPETVKEISVYHRENEIIISWHYPRQAAENIVGFYIERAEGEDKEFTNLKFVKKDVSSFKDGNIKAGSHYRYRIRPYSLREVVGHSSPVINVTPAETPSPPSALSYKINGEALELMWDKLGPNVLYNIYKGNEPGKQPSVSLNKKPLTSPLFIDRIEPEKTLYYTVRSLLDTAIGDEGFPSSVLEVGPASYIPSSPSGLQAVYSETFVMLLWNGNPETWIKGYRIYRRIVGETSFSLIGEALTPAFKDMTGLKTNASYRITTVGPAKESAPAGPVTVLLNKPKQRD